MVLDLVTYLWMMGFFAGFVLFNDETTFDWTEVIFASYVIVRSPPSDLVAFLRVRQRARVCLRV